MSLHIYNKHKYTGLARYKIRTDPYDIACWGGGLKSKNKKIHKTKSKQKQKNAQKPLIWITIGHKIGELNLPFIPQA